MLNQWWLAIILSRLFMFEIKLFEQESFPGMGLGSGSTENKANSAELELELGPTFATKLKKGSKEFIEFWREKASAHFINPRRVQLS